MDNSKWERPFESIFFAGLQPVSADPSNGITMDSFY